ncbi:MAG: major facilitator superfamily permease [Cytophagaceae bacterium]|nr:major facilitator superfamily permease [Cytophagaceae bacterium]
MKSNTDPYAVLKHRDFQFFIMARVLFTVAIRIQGVLVGWQIYMLTKDPLSLGMIGLAEAVPAIALGLYAGHLADKASRKHIVRLAYATLFLCSLALGILSTNIQQENNAQLILSIYTLIFITGIARGFISPAMFGLMTQCVPEHLYPNSSAWNSTIGQLSIVTGAAMSGVIYGFTGFATSYFISAALLMMAVVSITFISPKPKPLPIAGERLLESIFAGVKFVFSNQVFLGALSLDLFAVLFGGAIALLPIFAEEILHAGPQGLGLLRAAPALGTFAMAVYQIYRPPLYNTGKLLLISVAGFGVCMILFAWSEYFYLSLLLLVLSGAFDSVSVVIRSIIMQTLTPAHMKGRVSAVNSMFIGSSNEIGAFESGVAARLMGTIPSVVFGGCMTLLVVAYTAVKAPRLRKLNLIKKNE